MKAYGYGSIIAASAALATLLAGCKKSDPQPAPTGSSSAAPSAAAGDAAWRNEVSDLKRQAAARMKDRLTRAVTAQFENMGTAKQRQAVFELNNHAKQPVAAVEAWVYYYDGDAQYLAHHASFVELAIPAEGKAKHALGATGDAIPAATKTAECEIASVEFEDGSEWTNENLKLGKGRKAGGPSHDELLAREGEVVVGRWTSRFGESQRPLLKLANLTDRPLETLTLWTYYYAADGELLDRQRDDQVVAIGANGFAEIQSGTAQPDLDQDTKVIQVAVSSVRFTDGAKETWSNENLCRSDRPMVK